MGYNDSMKTNKFKGIKRCEHCGDKFRFKRERRRFCTNKCAQKSWYKDGRPNADRLKRLNDLAQIGQMFVGSGMEGSGNSPLGLGKDDKK